MTPEHAQARVGKVTASRVHDIIATVKSGGYGAGRKNYMAELLVERLTGTPAPSYQSPAMAYGIECEGEARAAYAFLHNVDVEEVGFCPHPTIAMAGASPDGLVGPYGLIEIKCPNTAQHLETLLRGKIPIEYVSQMHWQMACTGRQWCDFVSYDRRLPEHMRMVVRHVARDNAVIAQLEAEVKMFLGELDATLAELNQRFPAAVAA